MPEISFEFEDHARLLRLLTSLPVLSSERRLESALFSASLAELRPQLDLSGPPAVAIPRLLEHLRVYGRVAYEQHALGRFLSTVSGMVGLEEARFLDDLISRYRMMVPVAKDPRARATALAGPPPGAAEKIIGENTLRPISFLAQGLAAARSVAYVEVQAPDTSWSGTGFMVSPSLLITNHHVIPDPALVPHTLFRFNYQLDASGNAEVHRDYRALSGGRFVSSPELDYALIELGDAPGHQWGYLTVCSRQQPLGSRVNIVQHPNGLPKQVALHSNFVSYADPVRLQYITDTLPGSSGSPVLNDLWEVVALHRAGGWLKAGDTDELRFRNEGTSMRAVLSDVSDSIRSQFTVRNAG